MGYELIRKQTEIMPRSLLLLTKLSFGGVRVSMCVNGHFRGNSVEYSRDGLDLDGAGGRVVLRVLLQLCAQHSAPALVSGALTLLFRHFSQRHEVLQAFKQVRYQSFHGVLCKF